jgi:hypothetical protein
MSNRLIRALAAFLMTIVPATMIVHVVLLGQGLTAENLTAISPLAILIGISISFMPAVTSWRRLAPEELAAGPAWRRARPARAPISAEDEAAIRKRALFVFVITLLAMLAVLTAWQSHGLGPLSYEPNPVTYLPALMVAGCVAAAANRLARDRAETSAADAAEKPAPQGREATAEQPLPRDAAGPTFGRADRTRPSRPPSAQDAPDWGLLALLFGFGCLFLALGVMSDSGPSFLFASLVLGSAAAMGYDRQVGVLLRTVAMPGLRHGLLLLACCLTMLVLLTTLDLALKPLDDSRAVPVQVTIHLIGRVFSALAALLLALPLFAALVRETPEAGKERPLWPLFAALAGGGLCWYLLAGMWTGFLWPTRYGTVDWPEIAINASILPPISMMLGASASIWFQALTRADHRKLDRDRLFSAVIRSALTLITLALATFLMVALDLFGPARSTIKGNATFGIVNCLVWLYAFSRILPLQPTSGRRALGVAFALNLLLSVMFGIGGYNGWDPYLGDLLQVLVGLPVLLVGWWLVVKKVPRWVSESV